MGTNPSAIVLNPVTNKCYVGSTPNSVIDGATNTVTNIPGTGYFSAYALNPVTNKLYYITGAGTGSSWRGALDGATNTLSFIIPVDIFAWCPRGESDDE